MREMRRMRMFLFSCARIDHIRQRSYATIQSFLLFARSSLAEGRQANRLAEDRKGSAMRTFYTLRWMVRYAQDYCALFRSQTVWILMKPRGFCSPLKRKTVDAAPAAATDKTEEPGYRTDAEGFESHTEWEKLLRKKLLHCTHFDAIRRWDYATMQSLLVFCAFLTC